MDDEKDKLCLRGQPVAALDQLSPAEPLILAPNRAVGGRPRIRGALRQTLYLSEICLSCRTGEILSATTKSQKVKHCRLIFEVVFGQVVWKKKPGIRFFGRFSSNFLDIRRSFAWRGNYE